MKNELPQIDPYTKELRTPPFGGHNVILIILIIVLILELLKN